MKINVKKIVVIAVFLIGITILGKMVFYSIHDNKSQIRVNEILYRDSSIKSEFGIIKEYKVYKVGKNFDSSSSLKYYDYNIGIKGTKKSGMIYLKTYITNDGKPQRYTIE
ncbi:MAG: hypothetical protein RSA22_15020 [Acinetobacter sp.]